MAYATLADVQARAGSFAPAIAAAGAAKHPNEDDVDAFLADASAEIDAAIQSRGFDPAAMSAGAVAALKDTVAYGALARTLSGLPEDENLNAIVTYARKVWGAAMGDPTSNTKDGQIGSIANGSHPAIRALEAGEGGGGSGATAGGFWTDEPDYGSAAQVKAERETLEASLAPTFAKSQTG